MAQVYGDPHRVIAAYRRAIKQYKQIRPVDGEEKRKFSNFLLKSENITQTWIVYAIAKLPGGAKVQWSKIVLLVKRNQRKELEVADSIGLVNN